MRKRRGKFTPQSKRMNLISKLEKEVEILQSELKSARKFEFAMMRLMQGLAATDEGRIPFSTIGFLFELQNLAKRRDMKRYVQLKSSIQNAKYSSIVPIIEPIIDLDDEIVAHTQLFLQSEELEDGSVKEHVEQQIKFVDAGSAPPTMVASNLGPSYDSDKDSAASLGEFLSRPVLINQYTWPENNDATLLKTTFNPWSLYFNDPIIKKKLDNYARLQCKLHLKFVLNSSPFYYGNMRAVYFPLADGRDSFFGANDQITFSQPPGVYMNPATMTSVEMTLPFLWPGNWLRVPEYDEFLNMGIIEYVQYSKLRSANGVSGAGITISCYAWAEDVVLAGPTSSLALQSDEYDEGPSISGVATTVASVASKLTDVPLIGDMARATELGANVVGGVARLFGYSNPPVIEDVAGFHTKSFHAMANTDTSMPQDKLCLDPKNEITIDNSVTGIENVDPLAINHLATREAFLTGTNYNGAQNPGTILFTANVTPHQFARTSTAPTILNQTRINYTPSGWISRMFRQWRGSIVYKFVFVKSKYHTGRVAITWDPERLLDATTDTETTCFTRIVDLQFENEVEIVVPYKAKLPWLTTQFGNVSTWSPATTPALTYFANSFNGTIRMTVLNKLTGPATAPEIDVLCFAYAGDDIMFSVPSTLDNKTSFFPVQSAETDDLDVVGQQNLEIDRFVTAITVGESVASLRPLLHRTSYWRTQQVGYYNVGGTSQIRTTVLSRNLFPRVPGGPGFDPNGFEWSAKLNSAGNVPYSFVNNTHFNWIINAFAGFRGSVNHTYNLEKGLTNTSPIQLFSAERYYGTNIFRADGQNRNRNSTTIADGSTNQQSGLARLLVSNGQDILPMGTPGMSLTNTYTQTALMVNSPQYSQWRFTPAYERNRYRYPDGIETQQDNLALFVRHKVDTSTTDYPIYPTVDVYVSAGVDFSPVFFVCVPVMYEYSAYPAAANGDIP